MKKHPLNFNTFIHTVFASLFLGSLLFIILSIFIGASVIRLEYSNQETLSSY